MLVAPPCDPHVGGKGNTGYKNLDLSMVALPAISVVELLFNDKLREGGAD